MIYAFFFLSSLACFAIQVLIFNWFGSNEYNYIIDDIHLIVDLWKKDPIEKAIIVNSNNPCPDGTTEEEITFKYQSSGYCSCIRDPPPLSSSSDTSSSQTQSSDYDEHFHDQKRQMLQEDQLTDCINLSCLSGYHKSTQIEGIPLQTLKLFFSDQNKENQHVFSKLCISRIKGYSFVLKSPEKNECEKDEKYCSWENEQNEFQIENGYCIPIDRECYKSGIQIPQQQQDIQQLPLVGFNVTLSKSNVSYAIDQNQTIQEKQLLNMNKIQYPVIHEKSLINEYYFQSIYMPIVKVSCRASLKQAISSYIGPENTYYIALTAFILSIFSFLMQFFKGLIDFSCCCQQNYCSSFNSYCEYKIINKKHDFYFNIILAAIPIVLIIQLILNLIILQYYSELFNCLLSMFQNGCLYDKPPQFERLYIYCQKLNLVYICIALVVVPLAVDLNVYKFIFYIIQAIYRELTCIKINQISQNPKLALQQGIVEQEKMKEQENEETKTCIQQQNDEEIQNKILNKQQQQQLNCPYTNQILKQQSNQ